MTNLIGRTYCTLRICLVSLSIAVMFLAQPLTSNGQDIPLDMLRDLANMQTSSDVQRRFGGSSSLYPIGGMEPESLAVHIYVGSGGEESRKLTMSGRTDTRRTNQGPFALQAMPINIPLAENAGCAPTETVIEMPRTNSSVVIYPLGTKVKRCSGICGHSNLLCRPTKTEQFVRKGLLLVYKLGVLTPTGHQDFTLENHVACSCDCVQKSSDCPAHLQRYERNNCKCICKNEEEKRTCEPHRVWDDKECRCKCPNVCKTCPFGMFFDESYSCACMTPAAHSRLGSSPRRN